MKNLLLIFLILFTQRLFAQTGSLDSTFGDNGVASFFALPIIEILLQPDGKILINTDSSINRFNGDGSIDSSFNQQMNNPVYDPRMGIRADGKILLATAAQISQYNSDGTIDNSFGQQGTVSIYFYYPLKVLIQPDDKFVLLTANGYGYLSLLRCHLRAVSSEKKS